MRYTFKTASQALPRLVRTLQAEGVHRLSRNGNVVEMLNVQVILTESFKRELLCPGRNANFFAQIAETMWVLAGRNDIEWLSAYLPRAVDYSDDGETWRGGYGPRIRRWGGWPHQNKEGHIGFDQLDHVINTLREDPLSRRAVIGIYDPSTDVPAGKDVPCNDLLQFQVRDDELHVTATIRSNDLMWGWSGINAFEWSTLQEIVASLLGVAVGTLTFNIGNLHLYEKHFDRAAKITPPEDTTQTFVYDTPFNPTGEITTLAEVDRLLDRWFIWEGLCREGRATLELLDDNEDPLFKAYAIAIAYYWQGEEFWKEMILDTALGEAITYVPASLYPEPTVKRSEAPSEASQPAPVAGQGAPLQDPLEAFCRFVTKLHTDKDRSYGDSWKKRGEKMSILANIARKVDRLGVADFDDSSADTVIDMMVYLAKYLLWLSQPAPDVIDVNNVLRAAIMNTRDEEPMVPWGFEIPRRFNEYADHVDGLSKATKINTIKVLLMDVTPIARDLWYVENEYNPGVE